MSQVMTCQPHIPRRPLRRGFTLIEAAIVTVIVGVGTVAMIQLLAAGSMANGDAHSLTTGLNLARNIREMTQSMTYVQILDLDGEVYSPPVDSMGQAQSGFDGWQQAVTVQKVDPNYLTLELAQSTDSPMARVTVSVSRDGEEICSIDWLAVKTQ